jgi:phosphohistidine phosphatase SixA
MTGFQHRIYFIRHGETDWNREGRLQGQQDIPLNDLGRAQAEEAGRRLATLVAPHPLPWHVSPLQRTQETAKRARLSVEMADEGYLLEDRLKELSLDTEAQPVANYDTSLKATWTMLINLMSTLHGKPLQGVDYPNSTTLQNGMTLNTHVWELKPSGTALLGTSKLATGYMVSVRFTQEKIQPVRFGE